MTDVLARLTTSLADRYRIERELGQGGMATVYLAHDVRHQRKVALKVLRPELAAILGGDRFLQEIRTTANLQHPHILPLHDSGEVDGVVYYVMPYIEGESLRDRLRREHQMPVEEAVRVAREVADALDYAHQHGVVHRDIKPENILLQGGHALVADFGIALAASRSDGGSRMTETGMSLGTPHYMAPEQAMGERDITAKADIYALGCVLYEMLTAEPPFTGATAQAIVARVMTEQPRSLTMQRHTIPPNVEAAVRKALEKLPADRFATAADFAGALANAAFAATGFTSATVPGSLPGRRIPYRSAAPWAIAAGAVVIAAWGASRPRDNDDPAVQFTIPVSRSVGTPGNNVAITQDGALLAFVGGAENGQAQLFLRRLDEPVARPLAGATGALIRDPVFSPNGDRLAFYADQQLKVIAVEGGQARALARMSPVSGGITWAEGDRLIFQAEFGRPLAVVSAEGGEPRQLTTIDTAGGVIDHRFPWALPGGKHVVFTLWKGNALNSEIGVASLDDGRSEVLRPGAYPRYADGYLIYRVGTSLEAVPFDARRTRVSGDPFIVLDRIVVQGGGALGLAVSRNGTLVQLAEEDRMQPVFVSFDGAITESGFEEGGYESPRFSPAGDQIAVGFGGDIWLRDLRLRTFGPLTSGGSFYPAWSRDGSAIYFSRNADANVHMFRVPVDRSREPERLIGAQGQYRIQAVSPDGRHMLLRVNNAPTAPRGDSVTATGAVVSNDPYNIWHLPLDTSGAAPRPWLMTAAMERAPAFSPDGRWVAYSSDESGTDEIYVRAFPGPAGRTQVSTSGGSEPSWMPDGRSLVYRSGDQFISVGVRTGSTFAVVTPPRVLFRGVFRSYAWSRQYDIAPDGRRMLLLRLPATNSDIRVLVNWIPHVIRQRAMSRTATQ